MKTFNDLKNFITQNKENKNYDLTKFGAIIQIYESDADQMNIRFAKTVDAVIKIEERQKNVYTVAVANDEKCNIDYRKCHSFQLGDQVIALRNVFPDGYMIDEVVASLLQI